MSQSTFVDVKDRQTRVHLAGDADAPPVPEWRVKLLADVSPHAQAPDRFGRTTVDFLRSHAGTAPASSPATDIPA